jgi:hypothetical protein
LVKRGRQIGFQILTQPHTEFQLWLKGVARWDFKLNELYRDRLWFWLKRILPDGSQVNPIANIIFLVLVKEDRQMGSQVDRATNIILILEEKWKKTLSLGNSQNKEKKESSTLPSGRTVLGSG